MDFSLILSQLGEGFIRSVGIFFWTLLLSLPLGLLISFGRMSRNRVLRMISSFYISVMRGTPLMLQLLCVYNLPWIVFGIQLSSEWRFYAVIIGFTINYAAYFAEIYRSGIQSMPVGQYEAAKVLGYSKQQTFIKIILPQVLKRILPSVTNEVITLVKDTSLAFAIAYGEMFSAAKQLVAKYSSITALLVAGLFYYLFNLLVALLMNALEKRMNYYR